MIIFETICHFAGTVAFCAWLGSNFTPTKKDEKVVFNRVVTNIGSAYNATTGQFTAPSNGIYGFAWTLMTTPGKYFDSHLVVDGQKMLYNAANSGTKGGKGFEASGSAGILELTAGQKVWIRRSGTSGNFLRAWQSSFTGWQID